MELKEGKESQLTKADSISAAGASRQWEDSAFFVCCWSSLELPEGHEAGTMRAFFTTATAERRASRSREGGASRLSRSSMWVWGHSLGGSSAPCPGQEWQA